MKYAVIDSQGIVENIVVANSLLESNWVEISNQDVVSIGTFYDGQSFVIPPKTVEDIKREVSGISKSKRDGGIVFNGMKVSTDDKSRSLLNGAIADSEGNIKFVTSTGRAVLTQVQFDALYSAVQVHIRDCFANEYDLTEAIDWPDVDLSAIDINAGWPS
tara:strand:- start:365 stop:844 length:480 start_codon:yes stop_codon:yes gene_type:complete